VAAAVGQGATSGLPTCADDGTVTMTLRQVSYNSYSCLDMSNSAFPDQPGWCRTIYR
jgi:hypothetical protein